MIKRSAFGWIVPVYLFVCNGSMASSEILVIGDSWAEPIGSQLQLVLVEQGHADVPVHTTPYWGGPRNLDTPEGFEAISGWLQQWPNTNFLYMQMGQNNWLCCWTTDMIGGQEEADLFASIIEHTDSVINHILSIRPDIQILWTTGEYFRPHHLGTPAEVNGSHDKLATLAQEYAAGRQSNLTFLHWNGLFQITYGFDGVAHSIYDPDYVIPAGDPSLPNPDFPSPYQAYPESRPAHPTQQSYKVMAQTLYEQFFENALTEEGFTINAGFNDAWYNRNTAGQGFLISAFPVNQQMFVAWFTFDTQRPPENVTANLGEPGHRWLTAQGPYHGDTAELTIYVTEGGVFDSIEPAAETDPDGDGTLTIEFADCTQALVSYDITSLGISGQIPIERITPDNVQLCESLQAE